MGRGCCGRRSAEEKHGAERMERRTVSAAGEKMETEGKSVVDLIPAVWAH